MLIIPYMAMTVIGERSPCPYLSPQAFFITFSLCSFEELEWYGRT